MRALFGHDAEDAYLRRQLKDAIEYHLASNKRGSRDSLGEFATTARELLRARGREASIGFEEVDLVGRAADPLYLQQEIAAALRRLTGYPRAFLVVRGLRAALTPTGGYWTQKRQTQWRQLSSHIDALAAKHTPKGQQLRVVLYG